MPRTNKRFEKLVSIAIIILEMGFPSEAATFLANHNIPFEVAHRALTKRKHRRLPKFSGVNNFVVINKQLRMARARGLTLRNK
jgi:hypothetical protein